MIHKTLDGDTVEFTCEALGSVVFLPKLQGNDPNDEKCGCISAAQLDDIVKHDDRLRSEVYDFLAEN